MFVPVLAFALFAPVAEPAPSGPARPARVVVDVSGVPAPVADVAPAVPDRAVVEQFFTARCSLCHGAKGLGDGPSAAGLFPKPRRFSDRFWQDSVTDDDILNVILHGGAARKLSPLMPPANDLKEKPLFAKALVTLVRSFRARSTVRATVGGKWATADVDAAGKARVEVAQVPPGTHELVVERAPGVVHCKGAVALSGVDVAFSCAAPPPP